MKVTGRTDPLPQVHLRLGLQAHPSAAGLPKRRSIPRLMRTLGSPGSRAISPLYPRSAAGPVNSRTQRVLQTFRSVLRRDNGVTQRQQSESRVKAAQLDSASTITLLARLIDSCPAPNIPPHYQLSGRKLPSGHFRSSKSPLRVSVPAISRQ